MLDRTNGWEICFRGFPAIQNFGAMRDLLPFSSCTGPYFGSVQTSRSPESFRVGTWAAFVMLVQSVLSNQESNRFDLLSQPGVCRMSE